MLQLVIGTAGTGKSGYIEQKLLHNARNGKKSILIVPEQFSKTAEEQIFSSLEKSSFGFVNVFSFTSLLRDVYSEKGMLPPAVTTDAGKAVIAKRSLQTVQKQLKSYGAQKGNVNFVFQLSRLFDDLKRNGADAQQLYSIAQTAPEINGKLKDIAAIYSQYCADMQTAAGDMEDLYLQLGETLPESYTDSTEIFIDGFESFTHGQYSIIARMLEKSPVVYVALTADRIFDTAQGTHPLSYTASTAAKLAATAKKAGVQVALPVKLETQHRFSNNTLCNVDNYLRGVPLAEAEREQNAFVTAFGTQFEEVSFAAAAINKLTQEGFKYHEIAVVCPQLDKYEHQLQESFTLAEIPYFIDQNRIILSSAPVVLFRAILEIMDRGIKAETVLPLLKTQLTCFDGEAADLLENYTFIWQGQQLDWHSSFTLPYGRISDGEAEEDDEVLAAVNSVRRGVAEIFGGFATGAEDTGENILTQLYSAVTQLNSVEILSHMINTATDREAAQLLLRQWDTAIDCINQLYAICGKMVMRPREMQELFTLMVQATEIGFAPQTQDCVIISTPPRMKLDKVRAVLVLGAGQDVFPALVADSGVLSASDIDYLKDNNLQLSAEFSQRFAFENLYFYKTLTTAADRLFVSYARKNIDSQEVLSAEVEGIKEALQLKEYTLDTEDYCITPQFFVQYISETKGEQGAQLLEKLGMEVPVLQQRSFEIQDLASLKELLGEHMVISPTASEGYYKCPFSYLLKNLFKIYPLEKAQLSQREAGDYLHTVAQLVLEKYRGCYHETPWSIIETEVKEVVKNYLEASYPQQVRQSARFKALSENMQQNALQLLEYIHKEQKSGLFRPVAFEKQIGFDSDLKPVTITLDDGSRVSIIGVCDRIDTMESEGKNYIRIVDYKTGTKKYSLDDVYNGLSSQLLLYMNSVLASREFVENPVAAAVVYQPSDAAFRFDKYDELYTPVGMALGTDAVCRGFDNECEGRFGVIKGSEKLKSLTGSEIVSEKLFGIILEHSKDKIKEMAQQVYSGKFDNLPMEMEGGTTSCSWCGYRAVCREFNRSKPREKAEFKAKEEEDNGKTVDTAAAEGN